MTFYGQWDGYGFQFDGLDDALAPSPDEAHAAHARQLERMVREVALEHPTCLLNVSLSGHVQETEAGPSTLLSLSVRTHPDPEGARRAMDSSKSQDPFAPEEAEKRTEGPTRIPPVSEPEHHEERTEPVKEEQKKLQPEKPKTASRSKSTSKPRSRSSSTRSKEKK